MEISSTWQFCLGVQEVETMSLGRCEPTVCHIQISLGNLLVAILGIFCQTTVSRKFRPVPQALTFRYKLDTGFVQQSHPSSVFDTDLHTAQVSLFNPGLF